jgi:hypothetical protein
VSGGRRRFLEDTAVSLAASAGASVLNYAQLVLCGRMLEKADFGTLGSLLACIWLCTVVGNTLSIGVTREVAGGPGSFDAIAYSRGLGTRWLRRGWFVIPAALAATPVAAYLLHTGAVEVLFTLGAIGALLASSVAQGMTAGVRRFRLQGWLALAGAALKLAGTVAILAAAPTVLGALLGSALGYVFVVAGTLAVLSGRGAAERRVVLSPVEARRPMGARLTAAYFLSYAPFMTDQVLVQAVAPGLAGDYAALATLGKLTFHAVAPVLSVLFAYLVAHRSEPSRQRRYFHLGASLALALSAGGAGLLSVRPAFVAGTLFSSRYEHVGVYLPVYAFSIVAFTLAQSIVLLFLARGDARMLAPLAATFALQLLLLLTRHGSLAALTANQALSYSAMALVLLVGAGLAARGGQPGPEGSVAAEPHA